MSEHEKPQGGSHGESHGDGKGHDRKHKKHHGHAGGHHEEHEEGWIVSFADNVLLQMGFFVILLALNLGPKGGGEGDEQGGPGGDSEGAAISVSNDRFIDFAIEVRNAFNRPVDLNSRNPDDLPLIRRILERGGRHEDGKPNERSDTDRPQVIRPSDFEGDGGLIEFDAMSSELTDVARENVRGLAERLLGTRWMIEVRGHASAAESKREPRIARALAYDRAFHVAEALVASGLEWRQIRVVSAGEADPAIPRASTRQQHGANQRVEILKLDEAVPPDEFGQSSP